MMDRLSRGNVGQPKLLFSERIAGLNLIIECREMTEAELMMAGTDL